MAFATSQNIDQLLARGLSFRLPNNAPISSLYTLYANGEGQTYWSNSMNPRDLSTLSSAIGEVGSTVVFQQTEIDDLYGEVSTLSSALVTTSNGLVNYINSTITGISTFSTFYNDLGALSNVVKSGLSTLSTTISFTNSTSSAFLRSTLTSSFTAALLSSSTGLYNYTNRVSSATVFNPAFFSTTAGLNRAILSTGSGLATSITTTNVALSTNISTLRWQVLSTNTNFFSTIGGYGPRIGVLETASTGISSFTNNVVSTQIFISQSTQNSMLNARFAQLSSYVSSIAVYATAQFGSLSSLSTTVYNNAVANNSTNDTQDAQISTLARNLSILTTSSILAGVYDTFMQLEGYTVDLINSTVNTMNYWQSSLYYSTIIQNQAISQAYFSTFTGTAYQSTVSATTALTNAYVSTYTSTAVSLLVSSSAQYINITNSTTIGVLYSTGYEYLLSSFGTGGNPLNSTVVFIGSNAGKVAQGALTVAVGYGAGESNQAVTTVAIGYQAGQQSQGYHGVAIGGVAGKVTQGSNAVAVGFAAGNVTQGSNAVAVGQLAGSLVQGAYAVAIGDMAGFDTQGAGSVAIGEAAGNNAQGISAVAIGSNAAVDLQGAYSIAIGTSAGTTNQQDNSVAIGLNAASIDQGANSVAIGVNAGSNTQGQYAVAIGDSSGQLNQGEDAVAIGDAAGNTSQKSLAVAIGSLAGNLSQGIGSVAMGTNAGQNNQGDWAVALGPSAGMNNQHSSTIVINARQNALNTEDGGRLYIAPIRNDETLASGFLHYNSTTNEIVYNAQGGSGGSVSQSTFSDIYFSTARGIAVTGVNVYGTETARIVDYNKSLNTSNITLVSTFGSLSEGYWQPSISMSAEGKYMILGIGNTNTGIDSGFIYRSENYGESFDRVESAGQSNWNNSAMSRSGEIVYVACGGSNLSPGGILKSSDFGNSFTLLSQTQSIEPVWQAVACSADGRIVFAAPSGPSGDPSSRYSYMSYDYGNSFASTGDFRSFLGPSMSITGQYISVGDPYSGSYMRISSDYGVTWSSPAGLAYGITFTTMSANGKYQYAAGGGSDGFSLFITRMYYSSDYGKTFTEASVSGLGGGNIVNSFQINCDDTGQYVVCAILSVTGSSDGGFIYSSDYGHTFTTLFTSLYAIASCISKNGQYLLYGVRPSIYRSFAPTNFPGGTTTISSVATSARFNVMNVSTVGGFSPITFTDDVVIQGSTITSNFYVTGAFVTTGSNQSSRITASSITASSITIATTTPVTQLQINPKVIDDASFNYSNAPFMAVVNTPTTDIILNDPQPVAHFARQGTASYAYGARATLALSRYENATTSSRTRLDFQLAHSSFDTVNVMTMRSDRRVGIGASNPGYSLEVEGDARVSSFFYNQRLQTDALFPTGIYHVINGYNSAGTLWGSNAWWSGRTTGGGVLTSTMQLFTYAGGTTCNSLNISPVGNIGIGTRETAPAYKLHVNGNMGVQSTIFFIPSDPGDMVVKDYGTADRYGIGQYTNGTVRVFATSSFSGGTVNLSFARNADRTANGLYFDALTAYTTGRVGIRAAPGASTLAGGVNIDSLGINSGKLAYDSAGIASIGLGGVDGQYARIYGQDVGVTAGPYLGDLVFQMRSSGNSGPGLYERMRIKWNGNVGIGTSNPQYALDVAGSARVSTLTVYQISTILDTPQAHILGDAFSNFVSDSSRYSWGQFAINSYGNVNANPVGLRIRADHQVGTNGIVAFQAVNRYINVAPILLNPLGGNVSIGGTSAPSYLLDIVNFSTNSYLMRIQNSNSTALTGSTGGLYIQKPIGGAAGLYVDVTGSYGNCASFLGGVVTFGPGTSGLTGSNSGFIQFSTDGNFYMRNVSTSKALYFGVGASNTFGTTSNLVFKGNATTTWDLPSDQRIKTNIEIADISICLSTITRLPLKRYQYDSNILPDRYDKTVIGFIAQDVQQIMPKAVNKSEMYGFNDLLTLDFDQIYRANIGATQRLAQLVEIQQSTINAQQSLILAHQSSIDGILSRL